MIKPSFSLPFYKGTVIEEINGYVPTNLTASSCKLMNTDKGYCLRGEKNKFRL